MVCLLVCGSLSTLAFGAPATVDVRLTGRVTDERGEPLRDVMLLNGQREAFTDLGGRFVLEARVLAGAVVEVVAQPLDTSPCDDPGNCGISDSHERVAELFRFEVPAGSASVELQHDFRVRDARVVHVTAPGLGGGLRSVTVSCSDPGEPRRRLSCSVTGPDATVCRCPPGDALLDVYQADLRVPVAGAATRAELDLRQRGAVIGRLVHKGEPVFGHVALSADPAAADLRGTPTDGGAFSFAPVPLVPVHLVWIGKDGRRVDLGVVTAARPAKDLGDLEVPLWDARAGQ